MTDQEKALSRVLRNCAESEDPVERELARDMLAMREDSAKIRIEIELSEIARALRDGSTPWPNSFRDGGA